MQQHISSVCHAAYLELRRIASIWPYLTQSATAQLISSAKSAITSWLDYCNSILAGLPLKQISCLQRVQNNATKLVLRKSKHDHVTPLLQELHWLPVKFQPQYKIATFVCRFFDGSVPGYLSQTLCAYEPTRNLCSLCEKLLKVPKCNTKTFDPHLRNSFTLPLFKSRLKREGKGERVQGAGEMVGGGGGVCLHVRAREGQREREREKEKEVHVCAGVCVCVYTCFSIVIIIIT